MNPTQPICGPDIGRDTDERNAAFCLCGSADPHHRWFPREANPDLQQYHLSDGVLDLFWDHGKIQEKRPEAAPVQPESSATDLKARSVLASGKRLRATASMLLLLLAAGAFLFVTSLNAHARNPDEAGKSFGGFIVGVATVAACAAFAAHRWEGRPEGTTLLIFSSIMALGFGGLAIIGLKAQSNNRTFERQMNEMVQLKKDVQAFATGGPVPPKRSTDPAIESARGMLIDITRRQLETVRADEALGMEQLLDHPEKTTSAAQLTRELELAQRRIGIWATCNSDVERIVSSWKPSREDTFLIAARTVSEKFAKLRPLQAAFLEADVALLTFLRDTFGNYSYRGELYDSSSDEWRSRFTKLVTKQRAAVTAYNSAREASIELKATPQGK